jgi:hypothetical protein
MEIVAGGFVFAAAEAAAGDQDHSQPRLRWKRRWRGQEWLAQ